MRKILTPQQYSQTLDELNEIRPLQVSDIVKPSIDIGVCNSFADSDNKSVLGKLAKCTQHGSLLKKKPLGYAQFEQIGVNRLEIETIETISFSQPVKEVLVKVIILNNVLVFHWCADNYLVSLMNLNSVGIYYLHLKGSSFDIYYHVGYEGQMTFIALGFY